MTDVSFVLALGYVADQILYLMCILRIHHIVKIYKTIDKKTNPNKKLDTKELFKCREGAISNLTILKNFP